jgi:ParB-like chromosome segregation protein Spo0J
MTETIIPLSQIKPGRYQHRQTFKAGPLLDLAGSIRENGLINPPVVYRDPSTGSGCNGHYELLIGERRWRAMCALAMADQKLDPEGPTRLSLEQAIGIVSLRPPDPDRWPMLHQATALVRLCHTEDETTLQTVATVENLQREDLTPLEEARDFAALRKLGHSNVRIAKLTGKNTSYIKGMLDWLELEPEIQALLESGELHKDGRIPAALLSVPDPALRLRLARQFAFRRSPIRAILTVCERAKAWPEDEPASPSPRPSKGVPVGQVKVQVAAPASNPSTSLLCLCPACAVKIQELAEELCGNCRERGLTTNCLLNCDGAIEFINRLIQLNEAVYA